MKNYFTATLMSLGVPMILMGDEVRHTQGGNNNAYCQDNEISWFDWSRLDRHADVHRFVSLLCAQRVLRSSHHERNRVSLVQMLEAANESWHGVKLNQPDWGDQSHCIAFHAELKQQGFFIHLILNAYWEPLDFELPPLERGQWRRWIDTSLASPNDIVPWEQSSSVPRNTYRAADRSVVMLFSNKE